MQEINRLVKETEKTMNIVLHQPEIPANTGNIGRTCVATGTVLHLIEPLGFKVDDKSLKRAGMDYIDRLTWYVHKDWNEFMEKNNNPKNIYFLTLTYKPFLFYL